MSQPNTRPLSPHLQVYRPQLTSVLSISHRASGVFLSAGALVLSLLIFALAFDAPLYETVRGLFNTTIGQGALCLWTFAFFYHFSNGIRHLFWDMGKGFSLPNVYISGYAVLASALVLTTITLGYGHYVNIGQ